jgi:E3 ubiquitin-protein ligase CHFR
MLLQGSPEQPRAGPSSSATTNETSSLKRRASVSFDDPEESASRKKVKETAVVADETPDVEIIDGQALADELDQELQCGCCSALVYRPVVVAPCQHFFCGR